MNLRITLSLVFGLAMVAGPLSADESKESSTDVVKKKTVELPEPIQVLLAGFNAADPEKMGRALSEKCEVRYVENNGNSAMGSKDRDTLVKQMGSYFKNIKGVRSEMSDVSIVGRFVTAKESVSWKIKTGRATQYSLVVFELNEEQNAITRVWYYPAQK